MEELPIGRLVSSYSRKLVRSASRLRRELQRGERAKGQLMRDLELTSAVTSGSLAALNPIYAAECRKRGDKPGSPRSGLQPPSERASRSPRDGAFADGTDTRSPPPTAPTRPPPPTPAQTPAQPANPPTSTAVASHPASRQEERPPPSSSSSFKGSSVPVPGKGHGTPSPQALRVKMAMRDSETLAPWLARGGTAGSSQRSPQRSPPRSLRGSLEGTDALASPKGEGHGQNAAPVPTSPPNGSPQLDSVRWARGARPSTSNAASLFGETSYVSLPHGRIRPLTDADDDEGPFRVVNAVTDPFFVAKLEQERSDREQEEERRRQREAQAKANADRIAQEMMAAAASPLGGKGATILQAAVAAAMAADKANASTPPQVLRPRDAQPADEAAGSTARGDRLPDGTVAVDGEKPMAQDAGMGDDERRRPRPARKMRMTRDGEALAYPAAPLTQRTPPRTPPSGIPPPDPSISAAPPPRPVTPEEATDEMAGLGPPLQCADPDVLPPPEPTPAIGSPPPDDISYEHAHINQGGPAADGGQVATAAPNRGSDSSSKLASHLLGHAGHQRSAILAKPLQPRTWGEAAQRENLKSAEPPVPYSGRAAALTRLDPLKPPQTSSLIARSSRNRYWRRSGEGTLEPAAAARDVAEAGAKVDSNGYRGNPAALVGENRAEGRDGGDVAFSLGPRSVSASGSFRPPKSATGSFLRASASLEMEAIRSRRLNSRELQSPGLVTASRSYGRLPSVDDWPRSGARKVGGAGGIPTADAFVKPSTVHAAARPSTLGFQQGLSQSQSCTALPSQSRMGCTQPPATSGGIWTESRVVPPTRLPATAGATRSRGRGGKSLDAIVVAGDTLLSRGSTGFGGSSFRKPTATRPSTTHSSLAVPLLPVASPSWSHSALRTAENAEVWILAKDFQPDEQEWAAQDAAFMPKALRRDPEATHGTLLQPFDLSQERLQQPRQPRQRERKLAPDGGKPLARPPIAKSAQPLGRWRSWDLESRLL